MTKIEALRRFAISSAKTCKLLNKRAPTDPALAEIMDNPRLLEGYFRSATRLSIEAVESLLAPLVTDGGDGPPVSESKLMDVRTIATYAD